jgi:molybdate transport system substrate-binding protein
VTEQDGLRVFAAGSLRPAFEVLAERSPCTLRLEYANARDLARRIAAAEPADVFASASPEHPRALHAAGLVDEPRAFATNRLVVAVPAASARGDVSVLAEPGTRVVIEIAGIPLGDYTRELLARLDEAAPGFSARVLENVVAQAQTVDEVAALLLAGEADAAVLYATDVAARAERLRALELPREVEVAVTCVACVVTVSERRATAGAWVDGLTASPAVRDVMRRAGFGPPAS